MTYFQLKLMGPYNTLTPNANSPATPSFLKTKPQTIAVTTVRPRVSQNMYQ